MYARLKEEKERKRRYEEEQRRASEEVYVKIRACEDKGSYTLCILDARDNRGRSEIFTLPIWYKRNPGYYQMYVSYYLANGPICHFYPSLYYNNFYCTNRGYSTVSNLDEAIRKTIEASKEWMRHYLK